MNFPIDGYLLGMFPTEAEAVRRADYLPKSRYTLREWEKDGEFLTWQLSHLRYTSAIVTTPTVLRNWSANYFRAKPLILKQQNVPCLKENDTKISVQIWN